MYSIDSKRNKLPMQEIMIHGFSEGKPGGVELAKQIGMLLVELQQPNSEAVQFGNTVFIGHYDKDRTTVFYWVLNIDTIKNYRGNSELYARYLIKSGVQNALTRYTSEALGSNIFKYLEKLKLGKAKTVKAKDGFYETYFKLATKKK